MAAEKRSLITSAKIEGNGSTEVYYSFSPSRAKFWMGFVITALTLVAMVWGMKVGAYKAIEEFVHEKCGEYLAIFHEEVRPRLDADRAEEIEAAIDIHEMETSAEYASDIHAIQMEQAEAISEIKVDVSAIQATQTQQLVNDERQTRMLEDIARRID